MRRIRAGSFASAICGLVITGELAIAVAAPFTPGNLAVYRKGPPTGVLGERLAVFVDEYTPSGQLVQSLPMPTVTVGEHRRFAAESLTELDGHITRSVDGRYLSLAGLDEAAGTNTDPSPDFVVGRIDALGSVDTTTAITDWGATILMPRGAVTLDGQGFFLTANSRGMRYAAFGATTSTQITADPNSTRNVNVFNGQLYVSTASPPYSGIVAVGPLGTSTAPGQTVTDLPGIPGLTASSIMQYFFADLDASTAGLDTLYLAAQGTPKLSKYTLVSGAWVATGTVGAGTEDEYRGLTGVVNGSDVTLFATRARGTVSELVSLTDVSGFNGTLTASPTLLAATTDGSRLQGVAFTPIPEPATVAGVSVLLLASVGSLNRRRRARR